MLIWLIDVYRTLGRPLFTPPASLSPSLSLYRFLFCSSPPYACRCRARPTIRTWPTHVLNTLAKEAICVCIASSVPPSDQTMAQSDCQPRATQPWPHHGRAHLSRCSRSHVFMSSLFFAQFITATAAQTKLMNHNMHVSIYK